MVLSLLTSILLKNDLISSVYNLLLIIKINLVNSLISSSPFFDVSKLSKIY